MLDGEFLFRIKFGIQRALLSYTWHLKHCQASCFSCFTVLWSSPLLISSCSPSPAVQVMSKGGAWVSADALGSSGRLLSPTMFPPAPEQARELRLERWSVGYVAVGFSLEGMHSRAFHEN